jgi:hypothetical protein
MTVKYIHLRRRDPFWGHLEPRGGITVAYKVESGYIIYTHSQCSLKDHYNRSIGRAVSSGRLAEGNTDKHPARVHSFLMKEGVNVVEQILLHHDSIES